MENLSSKFPVLVNEKILLTEMQLAHAKCYSEILSDSKTHKYLTECGPIDVKNAHNKIISNQELFIKGESIYWSIIDKNDKFIGYIAVHNYKKEKVYISYGIHPKVRRKGYGTLALNLLISWVGLKNKQIEFAVHIDNKASFDMLSKLNFSYLGIRITKRGERHIFVYVK